MLATKTCLNLKITYNLSITVEFTSFIKWPLVCKQAMQSYLAALSQAGLFLCKNLPFDLSEPVSSLSQI
jgi:hypothetical protein